MIVHVTCFSFAPMIGLYNGRTFSLLASPPLMHVGFDIIVEPRCDNLGPVIIVSWKLEQHQLQ